MKTPKKLTPDPLVDSIVEIRIRSQHSFIPFVGTLFSLFREKFELAEYSSTDSSITVTPQENGFLINNDNKSPFLINDEAKIQLSESRLVFNCNGSYIGWQRFSSLIYEVLEVAFTNEIILDVNRVELRFINQFEGINVFSVLNKERFHREYGTHPLDYSFQYVDNDGQRIIIKLNGSIIDVKNGINISVVDISAIRDNFEEKTFGNVKDIVESLHKAEKEVFFGLIEENFMREHFNPTY